MKKKPEPALGIVVQLAALNPAKGANSVLACLEQNRIEIGAWRLRKINWLLSVAILSKIAHLSSSRQLPATAKDFPQFHVIICLYEDCCCRQEKAGI